MFNSKSTCQQEIEGQLYGDVLGWGPVEYGLSSPGSGPVLGVTG